MLKTFARLIRLPVALLAVLAVPAVMAFPASAQPPADERAAAGGYEANAYFGAPQPAAIGRRCIYPKFVWMVATNAPAGAEFHGSVTVSMGGKQYASLPYPRLSVNRWNGVQLDRPVCDPGRYRVKLRGFVAPVAYGVATNQIYAHVSGGATYLIR